MTAVPPRVVVSVWFAFFGPAAAWFLQLNVLYVLVPVACETGTTVPLHLTTVALLAVAVGAGWVGARLWRGREGALRVLGGAALAMAVVFALVILGLGAVNVMLDPCAR